MRLGILIACSLAASCGKPAKGRDGDRCRRDSDCASGVFCSMGTCDRLPCSSTIIDEGESPRQVVYERDSEGYVIKRTELRDGKELLRDETSFDDKRRVRTLRSFTGGDDDPEVMIRNVFDERGRVVESTMHIPKADGSLELAFKRSYEFDDDACPYASTGKIELADGSSQTIESACEGDKVVRRVEKRSDGGEVEKTVRYLYDERGRWSGVDTQVVRDGGVQSYGMRFLRDGKGRMSEIHVDSDGDGTPESIEKNDFSCFE